MESPIYSTVDDTSSLFLLQIVSPMLPVLWDETLIEGIAEYYARRLETNKDYILNLGCILVATAAGPLYYIMTEKGRLYLNLSTIDVGGSGISEKSLALKITRKILEMLGARLGKSLLLPSKFTTEGMTLLLHSIQEEKGETPEGVILSDEYTKMIKGARSKDYMANSLEYMAQLYSGLVESSATISRGVEDVPEVYVNFAGAATYYLITLTSEAFYLQGNGVRILFVVDDERKYHPPKREAMNSFWEYKADKEEDELEKIAEELYKIRERVPEIEGVREPIQVVLDADARRILYQYKEVVKRKSHDVYGKSLFDTRSGYLSRLGEFAMKKAALHAIARLYGTSGGIVVDGGDARFGVFEAQKAYKAFLRMQELERDYRMGGRVRVISPSSVSREKILLCLRNRDQCSAKDIQGMTDIELRTVQRHLKKMVGDGVVEKVGSTRNAVWRLL